jgi:hypothetical protein
MTASESSQDVSLFTRSRDRQSATNMQSDRCGPAVLLTSSSICTASSTNASLRPPPRGSLHLALGLGATLAPVVLIPLIDREQDPAEENREQIKDKIEDLNTLPCRVRAIFIFYKFKSFLDSFPNAFRGSTLQRESKHIASLTMTGRPVGSIVYSQTHANLERPAPKEVSIIRISA